MQFSFYKNDKLITKKFRTESKAKKYIEKHNIKLIYIGQQCFITSC